MAGPTVSLARGESGNLEENDDSSASIQVRLSEAFEEDVTLNLVGSGSATYGTDNDWSLSVGGTNCAEVSSGANCNVTVAAGETNADVMITVHEDGSGESSETIVLSIMIASAGDTGLMLGNPSSLTLTIDEDPPLPTVSLDSSSTNITEGGMETVMINLSGQVSEAVTLNIVINVQGTALYGTSFDWHISVDGTDCASATGMNCQITIPAGTTSAEILVETRTDTEADSGETAIVTVEIDSASANFVELGSRSSLAFTIEDPPTATLVYNGARTVSEGSTVQMTIQLGKALSEKLGALPERDAAFLVCRGVLYSSGKSKIVAKAGCRY